VRSIYWNDFAGAVTWGSSTTGHPVGQVSAANSLVGSSPNDLVGVDGVTPLTNGNYVVRSSTWNSITGAVTWGDGTNGTVGFVSAGNSLVGSNPNDFVGSVNVIALPNGNYVVASPLWNNFMGAATWGNGTGGTIGEISAANSLVGGVSSSGMA